MKKQKTIRFITIVCTILFMLILQGSIYVGVHAENSSEISEPENYETWLQTVYSRDNGLPVGKANDLETTSDGLIWIGTYAGLYRYNGSKFQLMNRYDTVKSVECLYVDDEDRLWVGTNDQGISVFQNEELIGVLDTKQGLPSDSVRSIMKSSDGYYYIGTADSMAVVTFKEAPELVTTIPEIEYADKSTADQNGNVIAVSSYGTMYLLHHGEIVTRTELAETDRYTSCEFDLSGYVHVGTSLGHIYVYEVTADGFVEQSRLECRGIRKVNNLIRVNESTIFVCADNGIGYFDKNDVFHSLKTPDFNSSIYNVILDYQGNLWFSSTRMGVLRLCKTSFVELFKEYSVAPVVVNSIERYEGKLYIGTDEGVVIIDEENHQKIIDDFTKRFEGIRIRQVFKDRQGHLWLGTYGEGAIEYDGENFTYYNSDTSELGNRARTFLETSTGEILVSTENGISFLRDGKVEKTLTENDGLKTQMNLCMLEKDDGTILIGSDGSGIALIRGEEISFIGKDQGLPSGVILRMVKDTAGDGVFVVTGNALCYLNDNGNLKILNNFPYSDNYDLILQDDTVFVLSSAGIYAVLREELLKNAEDMNYIYLDSRAGLHENLVANAWILHEPEKGKAYLATSFGTTVFDLQEYDERPVNFKVRVASITVDGVESAMDNDEHFSFSKKVNRLEIRPEIINYSTVDPIISCYLEGFDKHPIVMPQSELSTIVYTNLPAGKYSFHITLLDSESGVSISEKVYSLEKETEFTDTIWFYILIIGGVVLIATWIAMLTARRLYIRKMREKEAELEKSRLISATDELTGLKNRFAMREEFPNYVGKQLIVTMMDIDHFKQFNDTYGHDMGDMILKRVSEIILEFYAENGVAFRFGGDEFLFLDMNASSTVVENKLEALAEKVRHIQIDGCESTITVSYGSVNGFASTKDELRSMWKQADKSLYEIKKKRSS